MFVASILSQKPYVLTLPNFHCVFACHLVVTWFSEDSAISYLRISGFVNDVTFFSQCMGSTVRRVYIPW